MAETNVTARTDSGLSEIGMIPWGTHLCHLYSGPDDLSQILVPFLQAGLRNNEECIWVSGEPEAHAQAYAALRQATPDVESYLASGQLQIIPYAEVYLKDGGFDADRVLQGWAEKAQSALEGGYTGLRITGDPFWLKTEDEWAEFLQYEERVERAIGNFRIVALCTYGLGRCGPKELLGITKTHPSSFMRSLQGAVAAALVQEADDALRLHSRILDQSSEGVCLVRASDSLILQANTKFDMMFGYPEGELVGKPFMPIMEPGGIETIRKRLDADGLWKGELLNRRRDGGLFWSEATISTFHHARYGDVWVSVQADITQRKETEQRLARYARQLEILSQTGQLINSQLNIKQIMRTLVARAMQLVDATAGMYGLLESEQLVYQEYHEEDRVLPIHYTFPKGYGVPGWVLEHGKIYVCNDAEHDVHVIPEIRQKLGFYNFVNVPILNRTGELLGSFEILNKREARAFDAHDIAVLEGLAATAAVALDNARLFEERRRAEASLEQSNRELEARVEARTRELSVANDALSEKVRELEEFHDLIVNRELKMMAMEKDNQRLREENERLRTTAGQGNGSIG